METKDDNEIRTYSCSKCYLCGNEGKLLYGSLKDRLFGAPGEWNLKKCTNSECGLVWLDPMPLEEDIGKAYRSYYTHDDNYVKKKSSIWLLLRVIYRAVTTIPSHILGIKAEEFQLSRMYLNKVKPCRLLEIGCGSGEFLSHMQQSGWDVEGIDFDAKAVENVREKYGINARVGSLENFRYAEKSFDAITMNHVIEHVHDPVSLLQECYRILKPGGYLVLVTPNINSFGHQKFKTNWRGLEPPRHIHIFSQATLRQCANKSGFEKIETWTAAARSLSIFNGSFDMQKFGYHSMNKPVNKFHMIKSLILYYREYILLKIFKINPELGEEAVLFAQKN
jgi:2-polyprenyl-3-methyl-5-hydroxy-6-metoxy-1,4-benzoquinol methylase